MDPRLVESLIRESTVRGDAQDKRGDGFDKDIAMLHTKQSAADARIHAIEIKMAEDRGATNGLNKAPQWIALVISTGVALHTLGIW